ncbi:hypothetical protein ACFLVH_03770, partial [Chloroflexota bacterium]
HKAGEVEKQVEITAGELAKRAAEKVRKVREAAEELVREQAEMEAKEQAKRQAEEARRAKETEKIANKLAEVAIGKKDKRETDEVSRLNRMVEELAKKQAALYKGAAESGSPLPIAFDQVKYLEQCLQQVETTCEELRTGKIDTKKAMQRLLDITGKIPD